MVDSEPLAGRLELSQSIFREQAVRTDEARSVHFAERIRVANFLKSSGYFHGSHGLAVYFFISNLEVLSSASLQVIVSLVAAVLFFRLEERDKVSF